MLALLLDQLSGRPSFSPTPIIDASVFDPRHSSSDHCFARAAIAPPPPLETVDSASDYDVSRLYLWLHLQDHRSRPLPRDHHDQSFVVTFALRPELQLNGNFTVHQSFVVPRSSRGEVNLFQSSIFDRS